MFREQHIDRLVTSQEDLQEELQQQKKELEERVLKLDGKTEGLALFAKKLLSFMSADYAKKSGAEAEEDKKIIESSILELARISRKIKNISENIEALEGLQGQEGEGQEEESFGNLTGDILESTLSNPALDGSSQEYRDFAEAVVHREGVYGGCELSIGTTFGGMQVERKAGGNKEKRSKSEDLAMSVVSGNGRTFGTTALDGMGGMGNGYEVTRAGADILLELYDDDQFSEASLAEKYKEVHKRLNKKFGQYYNYKGSGFAAAGVECNIDTGEVELCGIGDASFLILRKTEKGYELSSAQDKVPKEQSYLQLMIDSASSDQEIENGIAKRNMVLNAIAVGKALQEPSAGTLTEEDLVGGDLIFSFSDGISDNISFDDIIRVVNNNQDKKPSEIREAITREVLRRVDKQEECTLKFGHLEKKLPAKPDNITLNVIELSDEFFSIKKEEERKSVASEYVHKRLHSLEDVARLKALIPEGMFSEEEMEVAEKVVSQAGVYEISSARSGGVDMYNLQRLEGYSGNLPDKHPLKESILTLLKAEKNKVKERLKAEKNRVAKQLKTKESEEIEQIREDLNLQDQGGQGAGRSHQGNEARIDKEHTGIFNVPELIEQENEKQEYKKNSLLFLNDLDQLVNVTGVDELGGVNCAGFLTEYLRGDGDPIISDRKKFEQKRDDIKTYFENVGVDTFNEWIDVLSINPVQKDTAKKAVFNLTA